MIDDKECVDIELENVIKVYMNLAKKLQKMETEYQYELIKQVETYFEDQADTELGDFLNDIAYLYLTMLYESNLEDWVKECIIANDCNYDMLYQVGETICCF